MQGNIDFLDKSEEMSFSENFVKALSKIFFD
jgi:hypothetical protein